MISVGWTCRGKLRSVGRRTVKVGMDRSRFDGWGWNRVCMSFALKRIVSEVRRRIHSVRMFAVLVIPIPIP